VLGGIWSEAQMPPETGVSGGSELNKDKKNNLRFIKSRSGHRIILNDKPGAESIKIMTGDSKTTYEFNVAEKKIKINTGMDIIINAKKKFLLNSETMNLKSKKGVKIEGDEILTESKGKDINIKAGKNVGVKGTGINLN